MENGVKAYRPHARGCNKNNWTVKNLVNNYSGVEKICNTIELLFQWMVQLVWIIQEI